MTDVGKVSGDKNRPEDPKGPKKKKGTDSESFREMMKVGKVRETDPEEKRERKKQGEIEEEAKEELFATPPKQGLGADAAKEASPYTPSAGNEPPIQKPQEGDARGPDVRPSQESPSPYEPRKTEASEQKQSPRKAKQKKETQATQKSQKSEPPPLTKKEKEALKKTKEDFTPPTAPLREKPLGPTKADKTKGPEEVTAPSPKTPPLPQGGWEGTQDQSKDNKNKKEEPVEKAAPPPSQLPETTEQASTSFPVSPGGPTTPITPLAAPFANLPAPIQQLFERMVGVMSVMDTSGIKETSFSLDNPQFSKSALFGAEIIITEYSTAPKEFNIELRGSNQAVDLMNANTQELVAAFQAGNYNFRVNRIDTAYLLPSKEARRKEAGRVKRKNTGEG